MDLKDGNVAPSLFLLFSLFLFLSGLHGSFIFSHFSSFGIFYFCPLWDLFLIVGANILFITGYQYTLSTIRTEGNKHENLYASASVAGCAKI